MNDMQELVTVEQAAHVIRAAALALPLAGLVIGGLVGAIRGRPSASLRARLGRGLAFGVLCGMAGPAVWALWIADSAIVAHYGLDSVKGLLVALALFAVVGLVVGVGIGYVTGRLRAGASRRNLPTGDART
jgi:hypothetical protein